MKAARGLVAAASILALSSAMVTPSKSVLAQTRQAIELTNRATDNAAFATDACKLWSSILTKKEDDEIPLPQDAMSAAHALYASALTRIGRDKDAIIEYQTSLKYLEMCQTTSLSATEIDVSMGLGKSLQRLLRYDKARDVFLDIATRSAGNRGFHSNYSEAVRRAVLCSMRLGDAESAMQIIEEFETSTKDTGQESEILGLKSALYLLLGDEVEASRQLKYASEGSDPIIYKWLYASTQKNHKHPHILSIQNKNGLIQQFAEVNNSAFDDPCLLYLDDKILLHTVVSKLPDYANGFYPQSFVIPHELPQFQNACNEKGNKEGAVTIDRWMLKQRSSYGSHGNRIVSPMEAIEAAAEKESMLCQKIIYPPMLIDGFKFSLRIYVVYFPKGSDGRGKMLDKEIFLSSQGLVKLASAEINSDDTLENQYMTNSGRGDGRSATQHNLEVLRKELNEDYENTWDQIKTAVRQVMSTYITLRYDNPPNDSVGLDCIVDISINHEAPCLSCIPKILGFDFMLDASGKPWLLEVNRFPGLEPRSMMDAAVKANVIYDAWLAATERVGIESKTLQIIRPSDYNSYSLEKLNVHRLK